LQYSRRGPPLPAEATELLDWLWQQWAARRRLTPLQAAAVRLDVLQAQAPAAVQDAAAG
jgi:hypothetical protein